MHSFDPRGPITKLTPQGTRPRNLYVLGVRAHTLERGRHLVSDLALVGAEEHDHTEVIVFKRRQVLLTHLHERVTNIAGEPYVNKYFQQSYVESWSSARRVPLLQHLIRTN
jgi:hypothetical protein